MQGDPTRYRYARSAHSHMADLPESVVDMHLRALTGVTDGPIPQAALQGIEGFWLHLAGPADFAPLAALQSLRWLAVESVAGFDVAGLAAALRAVPTLTDLSITAPIGDIRGVEALEGLLRLELTRTQVTDVSAVAALTHLDDLSITDGPLADLTPLSGLRLGRLFVHRTRVADLTPLAGMRTLQVLGLAGCPVTDLSVAGTLPLLHHVSLRGSGVTDLGGLPTHLPHVTFEGLTDAQPTPETTTPGPGGDIHALLRDYRDTDDPERQWGLRPYLVASRDVEAIAEALRDYGHTDRQVHGLLLEGGQGDVPFPANPWGVPEGADLDAALTHIWRPVTATAPRFTALIRRHTLGLALVTDGQGTPSLVYLTVMTEDEYTDHGTESWDPAAPRAALERLADPGTDLALSFPVGTAPHIADPDEDHPLLGGPVPAPLRALWSVHRSLGCIGGELRHSVLDFVGGDWDTGLQRTDGVAPDRLVCGVGEGDFETHVLDLDILDASGNPTVASWAWKEWGVGPRREFRHWLDTMAPSLALKSRF